jgi:hypothetical protein
MAKEVRPYLPIDLDWLDQFDADGPLVLGRQGGAVVVRIYADAPEEKPTTYERAYHYVQELKRLARLGQRIEREAAAAAGRAQREEPHLQ